ncbi:MAG: hypothetical protein QHH80_03575, partial [Anaerolineae bacterium]|nr:hypothetical protein [Anaerolineae bacterium]
MGRMHRTEGEDIALLQEIRAFARDLRRSVARIAPPAEDERRRVSEKPPRDLLETSLACVKEFVLSEAQVRPKPPDDTSREVYALWLFASYMAEHQGLSVVDTDFDALYEFFFWWYPRQCAAASPELTETLFATLQGFFHFLADKRALPDTGAVDDFWAYRDDAMRLLALYEQLDPESPYFEEQFD